MTTQLGIMGYPVTWGSAPLWGHLMTEQPKRQRKDSRPFDARVLLTYFDDDTEDEVIGEALGVGRSTVNKWRNGKSYMLGIYRADTLAIRLGKHPSLVWGDLWWEIE